MGLSGSSTKTTTKQQTTNNEVTQGTTTPVAPDWLTSVAQDYVSRIGDFGDMDPNSFVAPASPLQQMAWDNVGSLSNWQGQANLASQMASQPQTANTATAAQSAGATLPRADTAGHYSYNAPQLGGAQSYGAPRIAANDSGHAYTYNAPQLGNASLVSGQGYNSPQLGNAQGYAASRTGNPIGATSRGYTPDTIGQGARIASTPGAQAFDASSADIAGNMSQFQNPYVQHVVNAGLAQHDQAMGEQQARLAAQGARSGAFGGSRFGIAEGELASRGALDRATLESGLRAQAFDRAAELAGQQAGMNQQVGLFNAANRTGVSQGNAAMALQQAIAQGGLDQGTQFANQNAMNRAMEFGAGAENTANMFNAGQGNQFALDNAGRADMASQFGANVANQFALSQAGLQADASRFGAQAANDASFANQNAQNQFALSQAGLAADAGRFNAQNLTQASQFDAAQANQRNLAQAGLEADASRFGAEAGNQFALSQAGLDAAAGQFNAAGLMDTARFNAGQTNDYALQQAQLGQQNNQFNAAAQNTMGQFNAGQYDAAAQRQLQAAGLLGGLANDYAGNTQADLALMAQLGEQQRGIESEYTNAPVTQLGMMGSLSGMTPYQILVGQSVNGSTSGTGTLSGTQTVKQSGSLFDQLMAAGQLGATFFSDRRLKTDIEKIGEEADGLGLYRFRYHWEAAPREGVMADEVARLRPHALGPVVGGFATVNYGAL